jgi:hypothetical protein
MCAAPAGQCDEARAFRQEMALVRYALRANQTVSFCVDLAADLYVPRTAGGR